MFSGNLQKISAFSTLLMLGYLLTAFPLLKEIRLYGVEKRGEHYASCSCGCGGDESQCCCEAEAGVAGFRYCSTQVNLIIPFVPLWWCNEGAKTPAFLPTFQHTLPLPAHDFLSAQEISDSIEHPPPAPPLPLN